MTPFVAVLLAFAVGDRAVAMVAEGAFLHPPDPEREPSGPRAWRGAQRLDARRRARRGAGRRADRRDLAGASQPPCAAGTTRSALARQLDQLGGDVQGGRGRRRRSSGWSCEPVVHRRRRGALVLRCSAARPGSGDGCCSLTPAAPVAHGDDELAARGRRGDRVRPAALRICTCSSRPSAGKDGARLLLWVWAPALLVGAMTAYTSADGFVHAAVGLLARHGGQRPVPGLGAEPPAARATALRGRRVVGLAAVVLVTLAFQVQFQSGRRQAGATSRPAWTQGPGRASPSPPAQRGEARPFRRGSGRGGRSGRPAPRLSARGRLLPVLAGRDRGEHLPAGTWTTPQAPLPKATVSYYRRHREVPTLVVHLDADRREDRRRSCAPSAAAWTIRRSLVAPLVRHPAQAARSETVDDVLDRLPRL